MSMGALAIGVLAVAVFNILGVGQAIDRFLATFSLIPERVPIALAMLAGALPYFLADEWLTRGGNPVRGGYALTKLCFLASLALAIALNPGKLFFLAIIAPAVCIFFIVYGLISAWAFRATNDPTVGALANAVTFAWAIAVTFPVVG